MKALAPLLSAALATTAIAAPAPSKQLGALIKRTDDVIIYDNSQAKRYIDGTSLDCRLIIGIDRDIPYDLMLRGAMDMLNRNIPSGARKSLLVFSRNGGRVYGHIYYYNLKTGELAGRNLVLAMDGPGKPAFQKLFNRQSFPELCGGNIIPLE